MKATERESSILRPVNPLTSPSLGFGESDALTGTEPLRGGAPPMCVPHSLVGGRDISPSGSAGKHCYIPTSQAPDSPATEVLHGLGVHGRFTRRVGGPPEKQTT